MKVACKYQQGTVKQRHEKHTQNSAAACFGKGSVSARAFRVNMKMNSKEEEG
jgi:hypothetical protein